MYAEYQFQPLCALLTDLRELDVIYSGQYSSVVSPPFCTG